MKPNKTISILLTLIILLETLIPSFQNIAYGVEDIIEEVVESEIEESIDEVIEKENEESSEDVSNLEINTVQEEASTEEEVIEEQVENEEKPKVEEENVKPENESMVEEKQEETPKVEEKTENPPKQEEIKQPEKTEKIENKLDENVVRNNGNTTNSIETQNETVNDEVENEVLTENKTNTVISNESDSTVIVAENKEEQKSENKVTENKNLENMLVSDSVRMQLFGETINGGEVVDSLYMANTTGMTGSGTVDSPYIITTAAQLNDIRNGLEAHYKLGANINLSGYSNWNPIGEYENGFTGSFDGAGYTISNLKITGTGSYKGLFGCSSGTIKNVNLQNVNISGSTEIGTLVSYNFGVVENCSSTGKIVCSSGENIGDLMIGGLISSNDAGVIQNCYSNVNISTSESFFGVGGFVGVNYPEGIIKNCYATGNIDVPTGEILGGFIAENQGTIENCYATGTVIGNSEIGGFVGSNNEGTITQCYAIGAVTGTEKVGGFVGNANTTISNSFSTGAVTGTKYVGGFSGYTACDISKCYSIGNVSGSTNVGGFIGYKSKGTISDSYWTPTTTNQTASSGGTSKSVSDMMKQSKYSSWDFTSIWAIEEGATFAYLKDLPIPDSIKMENFDFRVGTGTSSDPYIILTPAHMNDVRNNLAAYYKLGNDIDLSGYSNWTPIGTSSTKFTGRLDGNGYTIKNLKITGTTTYRGLFAYNTGTITNLSLNNVNISSGNYAGALVAHNAGSVSNISVTGGKVTGAENTGGIIGYTSTAISNCNVNNVTITGTKNTGGIVGKVEKTVSITKSYVNTTISGTQYVGGIAGWITGKITECYSVGTIKATASDSYVGGIAGYIKSDKTSSLSNCYSTAQITGLNYVGGLVASANDLNIYYCYAIGKITATGSKIGGLIATQNANVSVSSCYWVPELTNMSISASGTISFVKLMLNQTYYKAWSFTNYWAIDEGTSFAYLKNLPKPSTVLVENIQYDTEQEGSGTYSDPYIVKRVSDFDVVRKLTTLYYKVTNDINLSSVTNFEPIGTSAVPFTGTFDGNGYTLSNLKITGTNNQRGLFGYNSGTIKNVVMNNVNISGKDEIGSLVGNNSGTITNISVSNINITAEDSVGGIVGKSSTQIPDSSVTKGKINGIQYLGGIVGYLYNEAVIKKCYADIEIKGTSNIGGIAGYVPSGKIEQCYAIGILEGSGSYVGGIVGNLKYIKDNIGMYNCFSTASLSGNDYVGGIAGQISSADMYNCYAIGKIIGSGGNVGPLVGEISRK